MVHSVTYDEAAHIPCGIAHWDSGDYTPYRVNPPLGRMLASLPVYLSDHNWPSLPTANGNPFFRPDWEIGVRFHNANRDRYDELVFRARLAGAVWSCLAGAILFVWATELYGRRSAYLCLVLWCFEPNVLGHAAVATPDIPCTAAGLLAMYVVHRYQSAPSLFAAVAVGLSLGIAQLTKHTLLVLVPVSVVLMLWPVAERARVWVRVRHITAAAAVTLLVINTGYEFVGSFNRLDEYKFLSAELSDKSGPGPGRVGNRFAGSWLGSLPVPLPADYVLGIDYLRYEFETMAQWRPSYLAGQWQGRGWWYYYIYALLVKLPVGEIVLIFWGALSAAVRPSSWRTEAGHYLPALAILFLVSSQLGFNHHARYVWPALAFLILGAGKAIRSPASTECNRPSPRNLLAGGLAGLALASSLWYYPHSMAYFNEFAGGPGNGHAHLLDSNIDWGQDALLLRQWLHDHPEASPIRVALSGLVSYDLPGNQGAPPRRPEPGWYAVSVNAVRGMGIAGAPPGTLTYFSTYTPAARVGYTIYIYHID